MLCTRLDAVLVQKHRIENSVSGSFHQVDSIFRITAGMQCSSNSLFALYWSSIWNVNQ